MLSLDLTIDLIQVLDELLLLCLLPENGRHVFPQGVDDVGVHLRKPEQQKV